MIQLRADDLLRGLSLHIGILWGFGDIRDPKVRMGVGPDAREYRDTSASVVFRGQANGADGRIWGLTPSVYRPRAWNPFGPSAQIDPSATIQDHAEMRKDWELGVMHDFVTMADGFEIPNEDPVIQDPRLRGTPA